MPELSRALTCLSVDTCQYPWLTIAFMPDTDPDIDPDPAPVERLRIKQTALAWLAAPTVAAAHNCISSLTLTLTQVRTRFQGSNQAVLARLSVYTRGGSGWGPARRPAWQSVPQPTRQHVLDRSPGLPTQTTEQILQQSCQGVAVAQRLRS